MVDTVGRDTPWEIEDRYWMQDLYRHSSDWFLVLFDLNLLPANSPPLTYHSPRDLGLVRSHLCSSSQRLHSQTACQFRTGSCYNSTLIIMHIFQLNHGSAQAWMVDRPHTLMFHFHCHSEGRPSNSQPCASHSTVFHLCRLQMEPCWVAAIESDWAISFHRNKNNAQFNTRQQTYWNEELIWCSVP